MAKEKSVSILVTAGGTREDIDTVRSITNHSTGRLGSLIADEFLKNGAEVTYLCGETSLTPSARGCEVIRIRSVAELAEKLDMLLTKKNYDCVVHSMAVSDFTPCAVTTIDEIAASLRQSLQGEDITDDGIGHRIEAAILESAKPAAEKKISSKSPYLVMVLKQTPKVIGRIKKARPNTLLVGFKLLSGVSEQELIDAATVQIAQSGCDYVLANDLADISGDAHKAVLVNESGIVCRGDSKQEIASIIYRTVMKRMG